MSFPELLWSSTTTVAVVLVAMALVAALEVAIPLHRRGPAHHVHLAPNLGLTFITFATNIVLNAALVLLLLWLESRQLGLTHLLASPPLFTTLLVVVALDASFYGAHVVMHKLPLFWRFHRVHHSDPALDVTTTIRQHPGESLIRYGFLAASACALGASPAAFATYRLWSVLNGLLEHSNMRVPAWLDRALALVIVTPHMHKVHHSRVTSETDSNYGNIFSLFDRVFSTFTPSWRGTTVDCGLDGFDDPDQQTTRGLLAAPFERAANTRRSPS